MTVDLWITIIVGIIGIGVGVFSTWFFKSRKKLSISQKTTTIIRKDSNYEKLLVLYDGTPISELKYTQITIKNCGNKEILKSDIVNKELEFEIAKEAIIFEVSYGDVFCPEINPYIITRGNNKAAVNFDFLEKGDYISFELLHDSSSIPKLKGKIISCKISQDDDYRRQIKGLKVPIGIIISFCLFLFVGVGIVIAKWSTFIHKYVAVGIMLFMLGICFMLFRNISYYVKEIRELRGKIINNEN